jgi:two-component system, chemotaxis family, protein-glutamate methylesterase/glutaminase
MSVPSPHKKLRVLVVDDSALVRKTITDCLNLDPGIEVVGSACDPYVAREKIMRLDPDVLTLDLEMPRMDGLTFLRILMQHHPMPVVVVSSLAQAGSQVALDALEAGAVDVLAKPNGTMSVGALAGQLAHHVKAAAASVRFRRKIARSEPPAPAAPPATVRPSPLPEVPVAGARPGPYIGRVDNRQLIVIGASTGGVEALRTVLPNLPEGLPPIAVVQHISPYFSKAVAGRLDSLCSMRVVEAEDGMILERGTCVVAPGDYHLALTWQGEGYKTRLMQSPPVHHCRPSVDVLFRSVAETGGKYVTAALLTGMGSDGAMGMAAIRKAGGRTIAEHEKTCVVYGMPRAAIELGVVDLVLPLPQIAGAIVDGVARKPLAAV